MTFAESADAFLTYCELERALSPNTLIAYGDDLKCFVVSASPQLGPSVQVTKVPVCAFIASQREHGLAIATVQRRVHCLRSFWAFLMDAGLETRESPLEGIRLPRKEHRVATYLDDGEMLALLDTTGRRETARLRVRDRAVIATFLFAGLRRTELLSLRLQDLRLGDRPIVIRGGRATGRGWCPWPSH